MDDKEISSVFSEFVGIIESLRDVITAIDEAFNAANEEVQSVWREVT